MAKFIISGFADEASEKVTEQISALKRCGIGCIEPRNVDGTNISDLSDEQAADFKTKLDAAGISVSSLGSPIGKINITDDFESHFEKFKRTVEIAKILGTDKIRMFSFYIPDGKYSEYRDEVLKRLRIMCDYSNSVGIKCCHENEKGIYGDTCERVVDLLDNVKGLYSVFDPANYIQCGETPVQIIDELAPRTEYLHIKDAFAADGSVVPVGNGDANIAELLKRFSDRDGEVILSLEPHLFEFVGLKNLQQEELTHRFSFDSAGDAFDAAANALIMILKENGYYF